MKKGIKLLILIILLLSIYIIGVSYAKYEENLKSNEMTIESNSHTPITATVTAVGDVENTFNIEVDNPNPYEITYVIKEKEDLYDIDYTDSDDTYMTISANSTSSIQIKISGRQDVIYEDMLQDKETGYLYKTTDLAIDEYGPYDEEQKEIITGVKIYLQNSFKNMIIQNAGEIDHYEEGHVFSGVSGASEASLASIEDPLSKETIYFFRGNITNNYVSFAGLTWRILRINTDGSIRLILDANATNSQYTATNTSESDTLESAIEHISWKNSIAYNTLQTWYDNNIENKGYDSYVVQSDYVFDTTYDDDMISSGTSGKVCYYGSYLRVGYDSNAYKPTFSYTEGCLVQDKIGLITGDEILYAGGYWKQSNRNYFLYNSSVSTDTWTMSPSFWDMGSHYKSGMIVFGSDGSMHDWTNENTITNRIGLRPVISIRGDLEVTGNGTLSNPYRFAN